MDFELDRMLVKTVNMRRPTSYTSGGTEVLDAAVSIVAYVEILRSQVQASPGTEQVVRHVVVTEIEVRPDDRIWLPGLDPNNLELGKKPQSIAVFNDPETGNVDHYEVVL